MHLKVEACVCTLPGSMNVDILVTIHVVGHHEEEPLMKRMLFC